MIWRYLVHEIYAANGSLTTDQVRFRQTAEEIAILVGGSRYVMPLAGASPAQLRESAAAATECVKVWQQMCSALSQEADRVDAELGAAAAAEHALRQAEPAGPVAEVLNVMAERPRSGPASPTGPGPAAPASTDPDEGVPAQDHAAAEQPIAGNQREGQAEAVSFTVPDSAANPISELIAGAQITAADPNGRML